MTPKVVNVHLRQTVFASDLVEENNIHHRNITPDATPYHPGLRIDACPKSDEDTDSPGFLERKRKYQSILGSIRWLAQSTHPNLAPSQSGCLSARAVRREGGHSQMRLAAVPKLAIDSRTKEGVL
jgi:hypothetical protein